MLRKCRLSHPAFDSYLNDLAALLSEKEDCDYGGLKQFLECKNVKFGWVYGRLHKTMFDTLIKLYNWQFSPKEAFKYINRCHKWYAFMKNADYRFYTDPEIVITEKLTCKGNKKQILKAYLAPKRQPRNDDYVYSFRISLHLTASGVLNRVDHGSYEIELESGREELEDALNLFTKHQDRSLQNKLIETCLERMPKI